MNQILDKISKALKLGTNNSNKNEAQNAILMAQKLMAKYHLSQEDVDNFLDENESQEDKVIEEKALNELNNEKWKRSLMITIAKNFRCDVYYLNHKLMLVGENEDINIVKRVYLYAKKAILDTFKVFFKENYETQYLSSTDRDKYKRQYAFGFIRGLSEKFEEQKANSEMALVVINKNVVNYLNNKHFSGIHRNKRSRITDSYCYSTGRHEGRNLADIDSSVKGVF